MDASLAFLTLWTFYRWLLRDPEMKVRTNYHGYLSRVRSYFSRLMSEVSDLQVGIVFQVFQVCFSKVIFQPVVSSLRII